ncbi:hypothetical protein [Urechidicola croceus]|uniref:Uncharacterized protein n=1 Tax=Urechidicola croceus TaxID=1850246 RepID=A0A1D8P801_9FLAO|nr:hypothetical protein [Urechidicola croceus]AOW20689.1 hypothetical protein LPB138_08380 [Urechidicola croceus]
MKDYLNKQIKSQTEEEVWNELYIISEHWKSDLLFYKDDLRFLFHLINKYIIWITKDENLDKIKEIQKDLFQVTEICESMLTKLSKHLVQLGTVIDKESTIDSRVFIVEHEHLEDEMSSFLKSFRLIKKDTFEITEYLIDNEKLAHI